MKHFVPVGQSVSFTLNTGQQSRGIVVQRIAERKQPVVLLIEQTNGWRCFRMEEEVTPVGAPIEVPLAAAG
jgi:hypothetical protein